MIVFGVGEGGEEDGEEDETHRLRVATEADVEALRDATLRAGRRLDVDVARLLVGVCDGHGAAGALDGLDAGDVVVEVAAVEKARGREVVAGHRESRTGEVARERAAPDGAGEMHDDGIAVVENRAVRRDRVVRFGGKVADDHLDLLARGSGRSLDGDVPVMREGGGRQCCDGGRRENLDEGHVEGLLDEGHVEGL